MFPSSLYIQCANSTSKRLADAPAYATYTTMPPRSVYLLNKIHTFEILLPEMLLAYRFEQTLRIRTYMYMQQRTPCLIRTIFSFCVLFFN